MNEFTKEKPTSQQLVDLIDDELDITICRDVVNGLDYEYKQLQQERDKYKSIVEEAIEYIKHSWWLRLDQVYDTSKDLQSWEVEQLFGILNKIKELEEGSNEC